MKVSRGAPAGFMRVPLARPVIGDAEKRYVMDALEAGWVSSAGQYVTRFEQSFARFCETRHGVSTANGTVALHLALRALDVREGDEVLIPALTFIAVPNAVRYLGARPVLVDSDPRTWCIDPERIEEKVSSRTRGIIAVHLYGGVCDIDPLRAIAERRGLLLLEDAAEAHGASYAGKRVGGLARAAIFSFYGNKIITSGEGGMLTTDDDDLADRARFLKDHGMSRERRYLHPEVGYNYRMTNLQAGLGLGQVERIGPFLEARDRIAERYRARLDGVPGIEFQEYHAKVSPVCWLYSVLITDDFPLSRDALMRYLAEHGIETRPFFVSIADQPPYRETAGYPVASRIAGQGLNLPTASDLSVDEVDYVCERIRAAAGAV